MKSFPVVGTILSVLKIDQTILGAATMLFMLFHDGLVNWEDQKYYHSHTLALDTDGIPDNNFLYNNPYDGDYFRDTDRQYEA